MKSSLARLAIPLIVSGIICGAQIASGGVKFPSLEPVMSVRTSGASKFPCSSPDKRQTVLYEIVQTDLDSLDPAQKIPDRSSTVRPLVIRGMVSGGVNTGDRVASLRGVDLDGHYTWDAVGYARTVPGVYRDEWEAFNDLPPNDPVYDTPLRFVRVVELIDPAAPKPGKPAADATNGNQRIPIQGDDDEKLSQELKKSLDEALTEAKRQTLKNGGELEISLDKLPEPLRKRAEEYAAVRWSRGWAYLQDSIKLDRKAGLKLWISPQSFELAHSTGRLPDRRAQQLIGVNGKLTDGRNVFF